jgi:cytochrome c peroxidase
LRSDRIHGINSRRSLLLPSTAARCQKRSLSESPFLAAFHMSPLFDYGQQKSFGETGSTSFPRGGECIFSNTKSVSPASPVSFMQFELTLRSATLLSVRITQIAVSMTTMKSAVVSSWSIAASVLLAAIISACGSGSGNSSDQSGNRSPVLVKPATDQSLITGHAFAYDVSQGGKAVTDPDRDTLTYSVRVNYGTTGPVLPQGLSVSGTVISGIPTEAGIWEVAVDVDDNHGGNSVFYSFLLRVAANSAPAIANSNTPQLLDPGKYIDYDATQNGTTFTDPDGDAITYAVTLRGNSHGLAISGTHISGNFDSVGASELTITASDAFGGVTSDSFLIAAPAPEPNTTPSLPATSYVYRDEDLPLPYIFRISSESQTPLWDTQPNDNRTTNAGATLGRVLFYDKRLSVTNTVSCGSCHEQDHGFASSHRFDTGVLDIPLSRNAMALANARYSISPAWFSDMRVRGDLRNLIFVPIDNHDELGMSLYSVESKLKNASFYPPLFAAAFGTPDITRTRIAAALAQFVQSLISYQAKSDLANNPMTNDPANPAAVFNNQEMLGLQIYQDHCAICHELHANTNVWQANNGLDSIPTDSGTQDPALQRNGSLGVFRAASLRNIAVSSPYMHDGRFTTLREVIDHYDHGVKDGPYLDGVLRDVSGPIRLNLSEDEKNALEAFLNTLTDSAFLNDPKFSDPFLP